MNFYTKSLLVSAMFALTACHSLPAKDVPAQPIEDDACRASQYQNYVGKPLSSLDRVKFSTPMRAIPHNSAVTMDFNMNRINFAGDKRGKISNVYCG